MTTVSDLIEATRRHLMGMTRIPQNVLTANINSSVTTLSLTYDPSVSVAEGSQIVIGDEIMYVFAITGSQLTVQRGMLGTTAAAHTAGDLVDVDPRFAKPMIRDALLAEINSWPTSLYKVASLTASIGTDDWSTNLTGVTSLIRILEVLRKPATTDPFPDVWRQIGYRTERGMSTTEFASGFALFVNEIGPFDVRINYATTFTTTTFTDTVDVVATIGLDTSMTDIPPYGAVWRLMSGQEVVRTALEAQGEARAASEVPTGTITNAARSFLSLRNQRIQDESIRLLERYPWRMT